LNVILTAWFTTRNFSKPASPIIAQMFNFLNLGFEGYKKIAYKGLRNARLLSQALEKTYFTVRILSFIYFFHNRLFIKSAYMKYYVLSKIHRPIEAAKSQMIPTIQSSMKLVF